jgi:predicted metal-dependent phosphoesterase TrpH
LKCDLHLHTTASDGRLKPTEIIRLANEKQVQIAAITDHDTVAGIEEALTEADRIHAIKVIPGVEINTDLPTGELHVLGYFIDFTNRELISSLEKIQESRVGRARKMVEKLAQLGVPISWQRILELAHGESICRPHIAQALLEKGYITMESEAFDKYIGRNGPAYIEREKIRPEEAVKIIQKAGGVPVLAHPADILGVEQLIIQLKLAGLKGLEAYYSRYDSATINRLVSLARKYDLLTTGGTDYHHFQDSREAMLGSIDLPVESVINLYTAAGKTAPVD